MIRNVREAGERIVTILLGNAEVIPASKRPGVDRTARPRELQVTFKKDEGTDWTPRRIRLFCDLLKVDRDENTGTTWSTGFSPFSYHDTAPAWIVEMVDELTEAMTTVEQGTEEIAPALPASGRPGRRYASRHAEGA